MRKNLIKGALILAALNLCLPCISSGQVSAAQGVTITANPDSAVRTISPYIYGVNDFAYSSSVTVNAIRQGGNRYTAYNWENNFSNAGSDYYNYSDTYLLNNVPSEYKNLPGATALSLNKTAENANIPFTLVTLQMAGYVSADGNGTVTEAAPSSRWVKVENVKGSAFSLTPSTTDGAVYMDEYVNYLVQNLGTAKNGGITAYSLDNEPALWSSTHSLVETSPVTCKELVDKSVALASAIKSVDSSALVFGPALYGYMAYWTLQNASDWNSVKGNCSWFIDYYLKSMKSASDAAGERLLDVLDVHYYTEAKCACGARMCTHTTAECIQTRLDSTRSLWDSSYKENSWIANDTGGTFFPLLENLNDSINAYYPGTKLAVTEYDFGGSNHIADAVVEADVLGIFAENGVYMSTLWPTQTSKFQLAAINMFTDYDGKGSSFGNTLVKSESSDRNLVSVYTSIDNSNTGTVKMILINKSIDDSTSATVSLSGKENYSVQGIYTLSGNSTAIQSDGTMKMSSNKLSISLPALSVTEIVFVSSGTAAITTTAEATTAVTTEATTTSTEATTTATETTAATTTPSEATEAAEPTETSDTSETTTQTAASTAETTTESSTTISSAAPVVTENDSETDSANPLPLILGIAGGVILAAAIVVLILKFVLKK